MLQRLESRRLLADFRLSPYDLVPGSGGVNIYEKAAVEGDYYLALSPIGSPSDSGELWAGSRSGVDGRYAAPVKVLASTGVSGGNPYALTPFGDRLIFVRSGRLEIAHGALAPVETIGPMFTSAPSNLVSAVVGGEPRIYFTASDGPTGDVELWTSDGTNAGTRRVADLKPGVSGAYPALLTPTTDGRVFFTADDGVSGRELWVSDGTAAGTQLVSDLNPGAAGSSFGAMAWIGTKLVFSRGTTSSSIRRVWTSTGTAASTVSFPSTYVGYADTLWKVGNSVVYRNSITSTSGNARFFGYDGTTTRDLGELSLLVGGWSGSGDVDFSALYLFAGGGYNQGVRGVYAINATSITRVSEGADAIRTITADNSGGVYWGYVPYGASEYELRYTPPGQSTSRLVAARPLSDSYDIPARVLFASGAEALGQVTDTAAGREPTAIRGDADNRAPQVTLKQFDAAAKQEVRITLDEPPATPLSAGDLALVNRDTNTPVTATVRSFTVDADRTTYTWTFADTAGATLASGRYARDDLRRRAHRRRRERPGEPGAARFYVRPRRPRRRRDRRLRRPCHGRPALRPDRAVICRRQHRLFARRQSGFRRSADHRAGVRNGIRGRGRGRARQICRASRPEATIDDRVVSSVSDAAAAAMT